MNRKTVPTVMLITALIAVALIYFYFVSQKDGRISVTGDHSTQTISATYLEAYSYYGFKISQPDLSAIRSVQGSFILSGSIEKVPSQMSHGLRVIVTGYPEGLDKPAASRSEVVVLPVSEQGTFSKTVSLNFGEGDYRIRLEAPMDFSDTDDVQYKGVLEFGLKNQP